MVKKFGDPPWVRPASQRRKNERGSRHFGGWGGLSGRGSQISPITLSSADKSTSRASAKENNSKQRSVFFENPGDFYWCWHTWSRADHGHRGAGYTCKNHCCSTRGSLKWICAIHLVYCAAHKSGWLRILKKFGNMLIVRKEQAVWIYRVQACWLELQYITAIKPIFWTTDTEKYRAKLARKDLDPTATWSFLPRNECTHSPTFFDTPPITTQHPNEACRKKFSKRRAILNVLFKWIR